MSETALDDDLRGGAEGEVAPWASSLARPQCPKCLYDLRASDSTQPCPECGYVRRPQDVVLILQRKPPSRAAIVLSIAGVVLLALVLVQLRSPIFMAFIGPMVLGLQAMSTSLIRQWRMTMSSDAYTSQVWLTPEGIGFVRDADRSEGRLIEAFVGVAIAIGVWLAFSFEVVLRYPVPSIMFVAGLIALALSIHCLPGWIRRARGGDGVRPKLTPWGRLPLITIEARLGRRVRIRGPYAMGLLTNFRIEYTVPGDYTTATALYAAIQTYGKATAVQLIG